jgi:hypothetical protein
VGVRKMHAAPLSNACIPDESASLTPARHFAQCMRVPGYEYSGNEQSICEGVCRRVLA